MNTLTAILILAILFAAGPLIAAAVLWVGMAIIERVYQPKGESHE